jgi:tetratricopeptide (TPR) repeat protein
MLDVDAVQFVEFANSTNFDNVRAAADMYDGEFLDGFALSDPAYQEWSEELRHHYHGIFINAAQRLFEAYTETADHEQALAIGQRMLQADVLQENVHRQLMSIYASIGQHNAALKQFEICQESLRRELDVEATPATVELAEAIRVARLEFERPVNLEPAHQVVDAPAPQSDTVHRRWVMPSAVIVALFFITLIWFEPWREEQALFIPSTTDAQAFEAFLIAEELRLTCKPDHYAEADAHYEEALKRDPDFVGALVGRASLALDALRYGYRVAYVTPNFNLHANALIDRALVLAPDNPAALKLKIEMLLDNEEHQQALELARQSVAHNVTDALLHQALARAYIALGERDKASSANVAALSLASSTDWILLYDIGHNFVFLGDYRKAILLAEKSVALGGNKFRIAFTLGPAYAKVGEFEKAKAQINIINENMSSMSTTEMSESMAYIQDKEIVKNYLASFELAGLRR